MFTKKDLDELYQSVSGTTPVWMAEKCLSDLEKKRSSVWYQFLSKLGFFNMPALAQEICDIKFFILARKHTFSMVEKLYACKHDEEAYEALYKEYSSLKEVYLELKQEVAEYNKQQSPENWMRR